MEVFRWRNFPYARRSLDRTNEIEVDERDLPNEWNTKNPDSQELHKSHS